MCLLVTAFAFGAIALAINPLPHCGYACYLKLRPGPVSYVYSNGLLKLSQYNVANGKLFLANVSLWSLLFEFLCYLLLAGCPSSGCCDTVGGLLSSHSGSSVPCS